MDPAFPLSSPAASPLPRREARRYTLVEMVVVTVILMLAVALVGPRLGGGGRRMAAEQALTEFRQAFGETAMRSRTTGTPLALTLLPEQGIFRVSSVANPLDRDWHPQGLDPLVGADAPGAILPGAQSYPVPKGVEWEELPDSQEEEGVVFRFYPDGEACGPEIAWAMQGRHYRLILDSVLGKATILEIEATEGRR
ncbi:MAG: type II secretion system protein [Oligosphaeraceae bacterium]